MTLHSCDLLEDRPQRVLLFGPQALSLDLAALHSLYCAVTQNESYRWLLKAIKELPIYWEAFVSQFPKYKTTAGALILDKLVEWSRTGILDLEPVQLQNIILSPLVVIIHLTEYARFLDNTTAERSHAEKFCAETLGFCTGFLSAVAVSLSVDHLQMETYGATAIRLAMMIGTIVDAQDSLDPQGPSKSLATAWTSPESGETTKRILARFPGAYISVSFDEYRATITTADKTAAFLQQELRDAGITSNEINLRGRFHSTWYADDIEALIRYCDGQIGLSLPDASALIHPTRANSGEGSLLTNGPLHAHALRTILLEHSDWYETFAALISTRPIGQKTVVKSFGPERCVPPSLASGISYTEPPPSVTPQRHIFASKSAGNGKQRGDNDIAIIGMSIKVAGADDVADFWDLLCKGASQHKEVPPERVPFENIWREAESSRKWFGNFIKDHDAFDQKFFKKSAREAASMDPQQRQMLQTAYQALEQAGYFSMSEEKREKNVGCYVGVCAADYENNVACYTPNAFTATGNLKSFIAGKISHYFGWTGPGLCIDTACSSSLVAVHLACKSILSGECNTALAGGVNVMTNPLWFQNLAAASFLSPTGQCKPFDASADGYCRGEGIAAVVLKRMSAAIIDGDQILGTIPSTAVLQNQNCTPIFVPNAPSLYDLFRRVLSDSKLEPSQIQYVEAHGTGTQVGDPAEYEGIRQALGGPGRAQPLILGSVKGLVGHTECTSGAVSLVKTVLMIQQKAMPPQTSFRKPNPHLNILAHDNIEIGTKFRKWDDDFRAALINNYGASGSNASMIVTQAPYLSSKLVSGLSATVEYPFRLCGKDVRTLRHYSAKLRRYLFQVSDSHSMSAANLAFNICRQSNPSLEQAWIVSCRSRDEFMKKLAAIDEGDIDAGCMIQPGSRPVVLCFGGQISTYVGLSRELYDNVAILRHYLEQCDDACRSIGCQSIFPGIFQKDPIADPVKLQMILFATQYSCAKSWIDCGVQPVAVVGHSFGELTSLCVSGVLSLSDTVNMIAGRAKVIKDLWGPEKGSMVATEADLPQVTALLAETRVLCEKSGEVPPTIACFNGPRSFTIAGSSRAIDMTVDIMARLLMRFKRLTVTNAFHSTLVESLRPSLEDIGKKLTFKKPIIDLERATEFQSTHQPTYSYVANHMRNSVYFGHAVRRLAKKYPSAIWLEAGSNSTITNMASRAVDSPKGSLFQSVNITNDSGMQQLTNATMSLWKAGLSTLTFWPHHRLQTQEYTPLILPSYQFEKSRHWMEYKAPAASQQEAAEQVAEAPKGLWSFVEYLDEEKRLARFRINTMTEKYQRLVSGHVIAQTAPVCPATLQVDIAIEALMSLLPESAAPSLQPMIFNVENQAPICIDPSRQVFLDVQEHDADNCTWKWKVVTESSGARLATTHTTGKIAFVLADNAEWLQEFSRYSRLVRHDRCAGLLNSDGADDIIQGRHIYKAFSEAVDYPDLYQGVRKIVGRGTESAGRVTKKYDPETWLDPLISDCFSQVGGIWVNCMTDKSPSDMYIAVGFDKWMRSPAIGANYCRPEQWDVLASHHADSDQSWLTDIFIFDPSNGNLMEVILGVKYHRIAKASMSKVLTRLSASTNLTQTAVIQEEESELKPKMSTTSVEIKATEHGSRSNDISTKVRAVLADLSGLEPDEIKPNIELGDIGIDSLMGMELAREIEGLFKCSLLSEELMNVVNFSQLVQLVQKTIGVQDVDADSSEDLFSSSVADDNEDASCHSTATSDDSGCGTTATSKTDVQTAGANLHLNGDLDRADLELPPSTIIEVFEESKRLTDQFIADYCCAGYMHQVLPRQTQLCIALTVEAFEKLGCPLRTAIPGQKLERIEYVPQQERLANYIYKMLEHEARLIDTDGSQQIARTAVSIQAYKSSDVLLADLLHDFPDHEWANRLTYFAGSRLADVLTGKCDGIKLIFGSDEGRKLVTGLYGDSLLNKLANVQMQDIITRLASKMPKDQGPLKILELGAGTGGTTKSMVALLAKLGVPVEYTFTDLSGSFVAAARKAFKDYAFMKFRVHDIEKTPANDLLGTQHVIIASNAVHATHSLKNSVAEIRKALRPDGFLMMLEMTQPVYWVDMIFGLFEGWWLFEDGRNHAIAHQSVWEKDLQSAGYGHVDWTDGHSPEVEIQRVFIALASGRHYGRQPLPPPPAKAQVVVPTAARRATIDEHIATHARNFAIPTESTSAAPSFGRGPTTVMITGASGSLGTHLVAHIATMPQVASVICLNRRSTIKPDIRQQRAMDERGILFDAACQAKLQVIQTDTSRPKLGLSASEYENLASSVTHIIHNAWPMSGKRPLSAMESQFQVMRNLVDLARDASCRRPQSFKVSFQFISSIAVVGQYGLGKQSPEDRSTITVPEERVTTDAVLPNGYGEAKFVCERILDETLHRYPDRFRTMTVRPGQVAGSRISGYWNPIEHLAFLIKSSQTMKSLPAFDGDLCWTPVEDAAGTLADLLLSDRTPYPVYHIDNPVRQPWTAMIPVLADLLNIPRDNVVPFEKWVRRVRSFPGAVDADNPAAKLIDFLDDNFVRMSCGGVLLGIAKSCEHSRTLASVGPVSEEMVRKYVQSWRSMGFLR